MYAMEVPVVYPTEEEFADPIDYLNQPALRRLGKVYGMVRIVPPAGFNPPLALDKARFKFKVRWQNLNELQLLNRARLFFINNLNTFNRLKGHPAHLEHTYVRVATARLHLYDLYIHIMQRKGLLPTKSVLVDKPLWRSFLSRNKLSHTVSPEQLVQVFTSYLQDYYSYLYRMYRKTGSGSIYNAMLYKEAIPHSALQTNDLDSQDDQDHQDNQDNQDDRNEQSEETLRTQEPTPDEPVHHMARMSAAVGADDSELQDWCPICKHIPKDNELDDVSYCDSCSQIFHNRCIKNNNYLNNASGEWICNNCIIGNGFYGFKYSTHYFTLKEFEQKYGTDESPDVDKLEKEFWDLVGNQDVKTTVPYGADIHSEDPAELTGFPTNDKTYSTHPMNLLNLPQASSSLLPFLNRNISGMTIPWIYVGSKFSTFCWHLEDQYTLSANYQHEGSPKVWYSIPDNSCDNFHKLLHDLTPDLFEKQPDLLHQLVSLISPYDPLFKKYNVKWYKAVQHPNEYIVTFPKCYHAGFNTGYNINEAVNFTSESWLPYGLEAISDYQLTKKMPVFDMYELMVNILVMYYRDNLPSPVSDAFLQHCHHELLSYINKETRNILSVMPFIAQERLLHVSNQLHLDSEDTKEYIQEDGEDGFFCASCSTMCSFVFVLQCKLDRSRHAKRRKTTNNDNHLLKVREFKKHLEEDSDSQVLCLTHFLECKDKSATINSLISLREFNELHLILKLTGNKMDGIK
ncbi:uncharacterized protein HLK63_H00341 [Nakaseomyces glabratus]|nr:uncharacterized protein GW608_H00341 [Nakaseomyces glabratus]UCS26019.1 uncharacterized protein HLK63_H00341 [Nakaseomyces glabratus]UCS31249.1 uncharacterized protein HLK64_H00341 [Nakaseomyces glabratus]UCS36478.1 uncharacterized protein HLK62_H00341 [Nakaseomyces glabratus]